MAQMVQGVIVAPMFGTDPSCVKYRSQYSCLQNRLVPKNVLNDANWVSSALSAKLGVGVKFIKSPIESDRAQLYNHMTQILLVNGDHESAGFGTSNHGPAYGDKLFVRQDGKVLEKEHVEALAVYVNYELQDMLQFPGKQYGLEEGKEKAKGIGKKISPEAFKEFFEVYKSSASRAEGWAEVECPVTE